MKLYQIQSEGKQPRPVTVGIGSTNRASQVDHCVLFCSSPKEQPALRGPVFLLSG